MVKVVKSTILDAPVDRVWDVLRDFNGHDRWHPAVTESAIERGLSYSLDPQLLVIRRHVWDRFQRGQDTASRTTAQP